MRTGMIRPTPHVAAWLIVCLLSLIGPLEAQEIPDLTGTWVLSANEYSVEIRFEMTDLYVGDVYFQERKIGELEISEDGENVSFYVAAPGLFGERRFELYKGAISDDANSLFGKRWAWVWSIDSRSSVDGLVDLGFWTATRLS